MTSLIETDRLLLKAPAPELAGHIVPLLNNPNVSSMLRRVPYPYALADAEAFLQRPGGHDMQEMRFAIHRKADGVFMGMCGYTLEDKPELGYWLGEPFWGNGYMSEAVAAIITHAFTQSGIAVLYSGCQTRNKASRAIIERAGFTMTHEAPMITAFHGAPVPAYFFDLPRERWESLQ